MKNTIYIIAFLTSVLSTAQTRNVSNNQRAARQTAEKIESLEIAYLTTELDLTSSEAQKFWPIFNEIKEERDAIQRQKKKLMRDLSANYATMDDKLAQEYVDQMFDIEAQLNESNFESRNRKIIRILGPKRFLQLKKAEVEFKRKLLREYRTRRGGNRP